MGRLPIQVEVRDHDIRMVRHETFARAREAIERKDLMTIRLQHLGHHLDHGEFVIDEKYLGHSEG